MRRWIALIMVVALAFGAAAVLVPTDSLAKGKPKPPPCNCAPTVGPCTLVDCGFDCVYVCPFPVP